MANAGIILIALVVLLAAGTPRCDAARGLTVTARGVVMRDGRPYRGIGVNYFSAFYRTLLKPDDTSYEAGFRALEAAGIPFCRLMGCGFWPNEQRLYREDKHEFFRRFDGVVRSAQRHHVGLIPSLFWNEATVPDLVGEPVRAWADPASRTRAYMRDYVRDVVRRYRNSPAIWGWEFGNEFNLSADLPNAAEHRPQVVPALGTPASRSAKDEVTYADIRAAFAAFAREVRRYDPDRLLSTGDGFPRESAWHNWKEKTWAQDTPTQAAEMLLADNPAPINVISVHAYGDCTATLRADAALARRWGRPLFVGEFGSPGPPDKSEKEFRAILAAIEQARVPLAALWVYDRDGDADWDVTATDARAYQLRAIAEADARLVETGASALRQRDGIARRGLAARAVSPRFRSRAARIQEQ